MDTGDYAHVLSNSKCELSDSGIYTVTVTNELGSDTANVRLTVVDKPTPPEGPLLITEITPDSARLTWKSPRVSVSWHTESTTSITCKYRN